MKLNQRSINLFLLSGMAGLSLLLAFIYFVTGQGWLTVGGAGTIALTFGTLWFAYLRGFDVARFIAIATITLIIGGLYPGEREMLSILVPPIFALVLGNPAWIAGSAVALLGLITARHGIDNAYIQLIPLSGYIIAVGGLVLGRLALDTARQTAEQNARRAEEERRKAEERAEENSRQALALTEQNARQRELLDLVSVLETPAVSVADGALLAPLIGSLDSQRVDRLTRRLLESVHSYRTRLVILDIAGVPVVDTVVASSLTKTVRALRLLGCEVVVTGISANVAATLTQLGVKLEDLSTAASPQEALSGYLPR